MVTNWLQYLKYSKRSLKKQSILERKNVLFLNRLIFCDYVQQCSSNSEIAFVVLNWDCYISNLYIILSFSIFLFLSQKYQQQPQIS